MVIIELSATKDPVVYDPLSPKNIFALGKLKIKKQIKIIIWAMRKIIKFWSVELKLIYKIDKFIINKFIPSKPLKPSIKFDPLIINKKQSKIKIDKKYSFFKKLFKNIKSTLPILIVK